MVTKLNKSQFIVNNNTICYHAAPKLRKLIENNNTKINQYYKILNITMNNVNILTAMFRKISESNLSLKSYHILPTHKLPLLYKNR